MRKELQKILNMPYSKLVPQVLDNPEYYDRMIHLYESILKVIDKDDDRETKEICGLRETMKGYIETAKLQKKALIDWGAGLLIQ